MQTIRKPPLAEAQTALGKQEIRSMERRYLSRCRNSAKTASPRVILGLSTDALYRKMKMNFTEISNQLLSYGQKRFMAAVRHLEFYGSKSGFFEKRM